MLIVFVAGFLLLLLPGATVAAGKLINLLINLIISCSRGGVFYDRDFKHLTRSFYDQTPAVILAVFTSKHSACSGDGCCNFWFY